MLATLRRVLHVRSVRIFAPHGQFLLFCRHYSTIIEHMFVSVAALAAERRALDAHEAAWLKKVAAYDRSGDWSADGFLSAAGALRAACRMDHGVARSHIELARKLEALPKVAAAFGRGEISQRHATVVANACTPDRAASISEVEAELVDVARAYTPRELGGVVRYLTDAIDGDGGASTDEALFERRRHYMSATLDGMVAYDGTCDPESGAIHTATINAEMERDRVEHDPRTPAQRRFDALTNLLRRSLDTGAVGETRNVRPHVTVVIDLDELPGPRPSTPPQFAPSNAATVTSPPRRSNDSPATATSAGSSPPDDPKSSTSAAPPAPSPRQY